MVRAGRRAEWRGMVTRFKNMLWLVERPIARSGTPPFVGGRVPFWLSSPGRMGARPFFLMSLFGSRTAARSGVNECPLSLADVAAGEGG